MILSFQSDLSSKLALRCTTLIKVRLKGDMQYSKRSFISASLTHYLSLTFENFQDCTMCLSSR